jgi:hypothetical protein
MKSSLCSVTYLSSSVCCIYFRLLFSELYNNNKLVGGLRLSTKKCDKFRSQRGWTSRNDYRRPRILTQDCVRVESGLIRPPPRSCSGSTPRYVRIVHNSNIPVESLLQCSSYKSHIPWSMKQEVPSESLHLFSNCQEISDEVIILS